MAKSDHPADNLRRNYYPILLGLYSIEKLLSNDLSEEYKKNIKSIKEDLSTLKYNETGMLRCMDWYEILVKELPGQMMSSLERTLGKEFFLNYANAKDGKNGIDKEEPDIL